MDDDWGYPYFRKPPYLIISYNISWDRIFSWYAPWCLPLNQPISRSLRLSARSKSHRLCRIWGIDVGPWCWCQGFLLGGKPYKNAVIARNKSCKYYQNPIYRTYNPITITWHNECSNSWMAIKHGCESGEIRWMFPHEKLVILSDIWMWMSNVGPHSY